MTEPTEGASTVEGDVAIADEVAGAVPNANGDSPSGNEPEPAPMPAGGSTDDKKLHVLYLNHSSQISGAEQSLRGLLWQFRRAHEDIEAVIALPGGGPFAEMLRDEEFNVTFAPLRRLHRPHDLISGLSSMVHILSTAP